MVLHALRKAKIACSNFVEILASAIASKKLLEEQEETIDMLQTNEREAANEIGALSQALEESGSSSEESYNIAISSLTKERDHALAMVKVLKKEKVEFGAGHAKLLESHDQLQIDRKSTRLNSSHITRSRMPSSA